MLKRAGRKKLFMFLKPIIGGYFAAGAAPAIFAAKGYTFFMRTGCVGTMVMSMASHVMATT